MGPTSARLAAVFLLLLLPATAAAQPERYELGRRLRQFEAAWEEQTDAAARKKALEGLPKLTPQFFGLKFGEAGRTLDEARFALQKQPPTDAVRWLTALSVVPERWVHDARDREFKLTVKPFYPVPGGVPAGATATVRVGSGPPVAVPLDKLPAAVTVPFPDGSTGWSADWHVTLDTAVNGTPAVQTAVRASTLHGLAGIPKRWKAVEDWEFTPTKVATATIRDRLEFLAELADGAAPETDLPVVHLYREINLFGMLGAFGNSIFRPDAPGEMHFSIPVGKRRTLPCRLFVPKGLTPEKPVPLVIALHGAGGTENLFFDGYGAGRIVKECADRGWLLVAPRCGFTGPPPADVVIDTLAARYPIDRKRVFLVGHSMGAMNTVALLQRHPDRFAAAACLGGGGRITDPKAVAGKPVFVGVGEKDFALAGARGLAKALKDANAAVTAKEYPDLEHLVIVREALPDVFAGFDKLR